MTASAPSVFSVRRAVVLAAMATLGLLLGCSKEDAKSPATVGGPVAVIGAESSSSKKAALTVLITGDEEGWLLPAEMDGKRKGGAAELLGHWIASEKHCGGPGCKPGYDATVALSTGNHWNGPAVSSFFHGESTAEVMRKMGYQVSVMGTHELAFGRDQFLRNRGIDGITYVAANLKVTSPDAKDLELPAYKIIERAGVKLAVVGLTRAKIASNTMAGRLEGLEVAPYEAALGVAVPAAWSAGADAVVVIVEDCPSDLEQVITQHADWNVAVVAGGHCHRAYEKKIGSTVLASPGHHFEQYLRAKISIDLEKPAKQRVEKVEVSVAIGGPGAVDVEAAALVKKWKEKVDGVLGEEIGFTKAGLAQESPQMAKWVSEAIRSVSGADAAIVNKKGLRQGLPAGKITKGSVYSVLPFENSVLVASIQGEQLLKSMENPSAVVGGVTKSGKAFKDSTGKAIDPAKVYKVATVDYLYFGGDGFEFEKFDPLPNETGMVWQTPVIEWTKAAQTSPQKPLESKLK